MTKHKLTPRQRAARKRAKYLAELRSTLTDSELNPEALKGMGLNQSDIDALLGVVDPDPENTLNDVVFDDDVIDAEFEEVADESPSVSSSLVPMVIASTAEVPRPPKWSEEWWAAVSPETRLKRCKAKNAKGQRCQRISIEGGFTCYTHGGAAPHVKAAARARIENATDRMAKELLGMAIDPDMTPQVKLNAIKDALDRGGLKPTESVVVSAGQPTGFDEVFEGIYSGPKVERVEQESPGLGIERPGEPIDYVASARETDSNDPTSPSDERLSRMTSADYQGHSNDDYGPREYGRPARPGAHVSGYEAMRIAREAQELSRRLAGLEEESFNCEM
ncbi:hypothetical protein [Mycolicibacterium fortuitum]|uniref:hypothetical protein n=1 Tax=Mycolicibacterium fortuitum TaxID=1766 RepID=UPI000ABD6097|nr:hypothetical protein [Mycolicibacterium fortuitum]